MSTGRISLSTYVCYTLLMLWCLVLFIPMQVIQAQEPNSAIPRFEATQCPDELANLSDFRCGYLIVPEDHTQPSGKTIHLMVAIASSKATSPAPDPLVMLAGGPGGGSIGSHGNSLLESQIRERRDIIYFDQRGTGHSEPSLACPELENVTGDAAKIPNDAPTQVYFERMRVCRDRLLAESINLTAYTSAQSAADIEALRRVLGYEQINLAGTSYGTRLGLTVIRDFPTAIRSAILDSVYPPSVDIYRETPANAERVFSVLFERCESDLLCNLFYPQLRKAFLDTFSRLRREPARIPLTDPKTNITVYFSLTGDVFASGVFNLLYDATALRYLPALIYAIRDGDYDIVKRVISDTTSVTNSMSYGMFFSVQCSEEAPFSTEANLVSTTNAYTEALQLTDSIFSADAHNFCTQWPTAPPDPRENVPVAGNMPVLILSGEHDPVTPPDWGRLAAKTLPNSYFYEFPGIGHAVLSSDTCPMLIAVEFLDNPQRAPDATCIADMSSVAFVITAPATRPIANGATALFGVSGTMLAIGLLRVAVRDRHQFPWHITRHLITWLPILIAGALLVVVMLDGRFDARDKLRLVELALPAALGVQAALVLAPGDDRTLEVLATCPRPVMWLPLERIAMPFALSMVLAVAVSFWSVVILQEHDVLLGLLRWISPALMFTGLGIFVTVRTRHMLFGALVTLLIWAGAVIVGNALLPGQLTAFPMNYIQPFFWIFHPYLQPSDLTPTDYVLNRIVVAGVGVAFMAWAVWHIRDTERLLFGTSSRHMRNRSAN